MSDTLELRLGALAPSIAKQLKAQKLAFDPDEVKQLQRCADAIGTLYWNDIIPDAHKLREKLYKKVMRHVRQKNRPRKTATAQVETTNP